MKFEDIKIGMKVKLLGKHALDNYDDINDWYKKYDDDDNSIKQLRTQGYGYVVEINGNDCIWVDECEDGTGWCFIASDLEPYEEISEQNTNESATQKTPKEWLLTPLAIFTTRGGEKGIVMNKVDFAVHLDNGALFLDNLPEEYNDNLISNSNISSEDIIKITYKDKVVWQRKEEYFTLTEAIQLNKQIKHKDWEYFHEVSSALKELSDIVDESTNNDFIIEALSEKVWEVR